MTDSIPKDNRLDLIWLIFLVFLGCAISTILAERVFDFTVFLSGILCVGLTAIGRREGYLIGLYNSFSYSVLAYSNGLYGEVYLNLFFFVPTGIIGYGMWHRHMMHDKTVAMRQLSWTWRIIIVMICIVCTAGLGMLLRLNASQNTPFIDASTNVLSIMATFLMMWRYKEQWLIYIVLNFFTVIMWLFRVLADGNAGDMMVLMWSLFLLNAMFGYWRWHKGAKISSFSKAENIGGQRATWLNVG